jgi:integrase
VVEFALRFMESYVKANRQKPSTVASKQAILDGKLLPLLGTRRLDEIGEEDVQRIKAELKEKKPKTVNNVLTVLSKLLKVAVKWRVIPAMPVQIELLKFDQPEVEFYEFEQYQQLVEAAEKLDRRTLLTVLLAGDAGLRTGEIIALEWTDVDFKRGLITVSKSEWKDQVTLPKGGRARRLPMTKKLAAVLQAHRHLRGPRVLYRDNGTSTSKQTLSTWMISAQRRAGLKATGNKHMLRHTFCSHLAMRGATLIAIKELAGHRSIRTTMRYMHLSPSHKEKAIELLDQARSEEGFGDILETQHPVLEKTEAACQVDE